MKVQKMIAAGLCAAVMMSGSVLQASAAGRDRTKYYGDVDRDGSVSVSDIIVLQKHLLGTQYLRSTNAAECADLNQDGNVDVFDLALLKRYVVNSIVIPVTDPTEPTEATTEPTQPPTETTAPVTEPTEATPEPTEATTEPTEATTEPTEATTEPTEATVSNEFISAPIHDLYGSLPSQGTANLVVFYVDFPDCKYDYEPSMEELADYCFNTEEQPGNANYPFESMHAFYSRASKGQMNLTGKVFRYTTKENKSAYENDEFKVKLVEEVYKAFNDSEDFSAFDADLDGTIDATLISVPNAAGDDDWWPCAGQFYNTSYRVDRKTIGHVIVGNAQVASATDHKNFCSSYLHEMGHCMGLPDYYLYYSSDNDGFHGETDTAGLELMDLDASTDFCCFSKLMLGWYRESQISVYDQSVGGAQTFTLNNAQTDAGNCLILPYGELKNGYYSEYMIAEYITNEANNSSPTYWWMSSGSGVRVYHVKADIDDNGWWKYFVYENGADATGQNDEGIRLIRMINDAEGGAVYTTGSVIDGNVSGFHWYDSNENETIDTGYSISIGDLADGSYTVTVTKQ